MAGNRQGTGTAPLARNGQTNRWWALSGGPQVRAPPARSPDPGRVLDDTPPPPPPSFIRRQLGWIDDAQVGACVSS